MKTEVIKLYENREDVTLTTYVLEDSPEMLAGKSRPAILICPGGGYMSCSDREAEPIAMKFASMGYHTFVLRYSTYMGGNAGGFPDISKPLPVKEECLYPTQMREIGQAMLIIREHAKAWKVDADRADSQQEHIMLLCMQQTGIQIQSVSTSMKTKKNSVRQQQFLAIH